MVTNFQRTYYARVTARPKRRVSLGGILLGLLIAAALIALGLLCQWP